MTHSDSRRDDHEPDDHEPIDRSLHRPVSSRQTPLDTDMTPAILHAPSQPADRPSKSLVRVEAPPVASADEERAFEVHVGVLEESHKLTGKYIARYFTPKK